MKRAVLWDSSAILAFIDRSDQNHQQARVVGIELAKKEQIAVITNYIRAEAHVLLLARLGRSIAREWLLTQRPHVIHVAAHEETRAVEIIATFTDKDWSFCDATSFAVMETRRISTAFAFDRHFKQFSSLKVMGLH